MFRKKIAAIHFGAGNIGRGLIADIYLKNNIIPIFIDKDIKLVNQLTKEKEYKINFNDGNSETISNFFIVSNIEDLKKIVNDNGFKIKFISTSIGTKNFEFIKEDLNKIFLLVKNKVNVISFENDFLSSSMLKEVMFDNNKKHIYINCIVDRIVPIQKNKSLNIFTEKYFEIILDKKNKTNNLLKNEVIWVNKFEPYLFRKLWIINSTHLMLGYLFNDVTYTFEINDKNYNRYDEFNKIISTWLKSLKIIICNEFNFTENEINKYIEQNMKRIFSLETKDKTKRLRRDPIKKLKENERVFSLRKYLKKYNENLDIIDRLIYLMFVVIDNEDIQSKEIYKTNKENGINFSMSKYTPLTKNEINEIINKWKDNIE